METLRQTQKRYGTAAITTAVVIGVFFILAGQKPVAKGLILGSIFSVINFILMGEILPLRIGKSKRKTFFLSLGSIFFRYALLAIPLIVAVKFEPFNVFSTIFGIFMIQMIILADHVLKLITSLREKQV